MDVRLPDGLRMYYEDCGQGEPVLLIHGLRCSHVTWRHQLPALSADFRVIAPDLRGHGSTDKPPGPYSLDLWAGDLLALLDCLELPRVALVGHSMGGGISQYVALTYPERVRALALISTSPRRAPRVSGALAKSAQIAQQEGRLPAPAASVRARVGPGYAEAHPDEVEIEARSMVTDVQAFAAACLGNAGERDWLARLPELAVPLLYVAGAEDRADTATNAAHYRERVRNAETHIFPGVGHMVPMEAPDRLNPLLLGFLRRLDGNH